jgi:pimeloyl-ACP methyl ester carboxylesterase
VPYLRGYGTTRFLSSETFRNAQQSAVALDIIALMDALKIQKAIIGGFDWGARTVDVMAALWPERCKGIVSVSGYLISSPAGNQVPLPPKPAFAFWYQYYFATELGKAGYVKYLDDFNKLIWQTASPKWNFDDATYDRTAASFNNPDHVDIVMHDYRWRLGLADGERKYDALEKRLATLPVITVPTITMEGDSNGAAHPPSTAYRDKFSGKYEYRLLTGGIGHNLPQEAPQAFAHPAAALSVFEAARDEEAARRSIEKLDQLNQQRRQLVAAHFGRICAEVPQPAPPALVLYQEACPKGVAGLLAAKCVERFGVPSIVLAPSTEPGLVVGSGRSVPGFDLAQAFEQFRRFFQRFGGHAQAVGLTMPVCHIEAFSKEFTSFVEGLELDRNREIRKDGELELATAGKQFDEQLALLEPFGEGKPAETNATSSLKPASSSRFFG